MESATVKLDEEQTIQICLVISATILTIQIPILLFFNIIILILFK